jgi:eukaryotic-like serine/threonine-protein kinase
MIGQRLLHYQVVEKLGEGGMGVVYRARDNHLDRFVAIKVLQPEKVSDPTRKARFIQEARAASALNHPNIITVHDISTDSGVDFIAMEFVDGKTLDQLIPRKGMRLNEALKIAIQIADALARAHAAGIIHRDLKPANIMVDAHGHVKVLDFGLAKLTETTTSSDAETLTNALDTAEGTVVGTAAYMSPEQAEGKPVDARSDVFSFGAVLYEMLAGHRPFAGDSRMSTLSAVLHKDPPPLDSVVPHDVARIVLQCLRKDPRRRFQHVDDLQVALLDVKEESDSGGLTAVPPSPSLVRPTGPWRTAGVIALLAAILAGAGWLAWRGRAVSPAHFAVTPLTTYAGNEAFPSFSHDSKKVAYMWDGERPDEIGIFYRSNIFVKQIGSDSQLRLTSASGVSSVAWSPDDSKILFHRRAGTRLIFSVVDALGGPERPVRELDTGPGRRGFCGAAAWMPDSNGVVFQDGQLLEMDTNTLRRLWPAPPAGADDRCVAVSPDGRTVAFTRFTGMIDGEIYALGLTPDFQPAGEPRRLTHLSRLAYSPTFTADGKEILFVLRRAWIGGGSLYRIPVDGAAEPRLIPVGQNVAYQVAASTRPDRIAFVQQHSNTNIFRLPLDAEGRQAGPAEPLIASSRLDYNPAYSPDGAQIAFVSDRNGQTSIWKCRADGREPVVLFSRPNGHADWPAWSPDSKQVAFSFAGSAARDIWVVPSSGGNPQRLTESPADDLSPCFSLDGQSVYFGSSRSGRYEVWKTPAGGGQPHQVTQHGGLGGCESPDGGSIYFYKELSNSAPVWTTTVSGGAEAAALPAVRNYSLTVVGGGLYFISLAEETGEYSLQFKDAGTGSIRTVVSLGRRLGNGFSLSPDRRSLLFVKEEGAGRDLMLVENFR